MLVAAANNSSLLQLLAGSSQVLSSSNSSAAGVTTALSAANQLYPSSDTVQNTVVSGSNSLGGDLTLKISSEGQIALSNSQQTSGNASDYSAADFYSGIPQSLMEGYDSYLNSLSTAWNQVESSVQSGDTASAGSELQSFTAQWKSDYYDGSSAAQQAYSDLQQMGSDLSAQNLSAARSDAAAAVSAGLFGSGDAVDNTLGQAELAGAQTSNWVQDLASFGSSLSPNSVGTAATSSASSGDSFTQALTSYENALKKDSTSLQNYLVSQGASEQQAQADVSMFNYAQTVDGLSVIADSVAGSTGSQDTYTIASSIAVASKETSGATTVSSSYAFASVSQIQAAYAMQTSVAVVASQTVSNGAESSTLTADGLVEYGAGNPLIAAALSGSSSSATASQSTAGLTGGTQDESAYLAKFSITDSSASVASESTSVSVSADSGAAIAWSDAVNVQASWSTYGGWNSSIPVQDANNDSMQKDWSSVEQTINSISTSKGHDALQILNQQTESGSRTAAQQSQQ
jgi:hypothetical protein